jgi:RNA polymerase sigma-70 factor (ECF subfamily)
MDKDQQDNRVDAALARVRAGDREAYLIVVEAVQHEVRCAIAAHADSAELVEEILQRTFVTGFEKLAQYRGEGDFSAWLKAIARNHLRQEWRSRERLAAFDQDAVTALIAQAEAAELDAASAADTAEDLERLAACLELLPAAGRRLLDLRYGRGLDIDGLAQQAGRSSAAVAMALSRLRTVLRRCLESA